MLFLFFFNDSKKVLLWKNSLEGVFMKKMACLACLVLLFSCQRTSSTMVRAFSSDPTKKDYAVESFSEAISRGTALDLQDRKIMENSSPRTLDRMDRGESITISDIIKLSQGGICDDIIIRYIHDTKTSYHLTLAQIRRLRQGGVSQRVIRYVYDTRS